MSYNDTQEEFFVACEKGTIDDVKKIIEPYLTSLKALGEILINDPLNSDVINEIINVKNELNKLANKVNRSCTPLYKAFMHNTLDVIKWLCETIGCIDKTPPSIFMFYACENKNGSLSIIKYLLEESPPHIRDKIDINFKDGNDETILLVASKLDIVKYLLEESPQHFRDKIDINVCDGVGDNVLTINTNVNITKYLLLESPPHIRELMDINHRDKKYESELDYILANIDEKNYYYLIFLLELFNSPISNNIQDNKKLKVSDKNLISIITSFKNFPYHLLEKYTQKSQLQNFINYQQNKTRLIERHLSMVCNDVKDIIYSYL